MEAYDDLRAAFSEHDRSRLADSAARARDRYNLILDSMKFYFHTSWRSSVCPNYRANSQIQFVSHVLPPSGEKDCSIRADFGEIFNQT